MWALLPPHFASSLRFFKYRLRGLFPWSAFSAAAYSHHDSHANQSIFGKHRGTQLFNLSDLFNGDGNAPHPLPLIFWEGVGMWNVTATFHQFRKYRQHACCPHSFPFISGDLFRLFADVIIEDDAELNLLQLRSTLASVQQRAVIAFVKTDFTDFFLFVILPEIVDAGHRVVIITQNSDFPLSRLNAQALRHPSILAVFGENCDFTHPKVFCLPLGIENSRYTVGAQVGLLLEKMVAAWERRARLPLTPVAAVSQLQKLGVPFVLANFRVTSHTSRLLAWDAALRARCVDAQPPASSGQQDRFWSDAGTFPIVFTPRGNGIDTHRLWEVLYLGSVPVMVEEAPFTDMLRHLDAPVLVLPRWSALTEEALVNQLRLWLTEYNAAQDVACILAGSCWWRPSNKIFAPFWLCAISKAAHFPAAQDWCTLSRIERHMESVSVE
ncbi:MAG: hypothetical protein EOO65_02365 [Methanosarcinales archaeon]|nr:MAG: hypothetical protein EOO65_02365 [Methanosarcinales archaeon]